MTNPDGEKIDENASPWQSNSSTGAAPVPAQSLSSRDSSTSSTTSTSPDLERLQTASLYASRVETQRTQHAYTVGETERTRSRLSAPLPAFGGGKSYPPPLPEKDDYVVEFDGPDDPLHPQNWKLGRK